MIITEIKSLLNEISNDFIQRKLGTTLDKYGKVIPGKVFGKRTLDLFTSANQLAHAKRQAKKTGKPIPPDMSGGVKARLRAAHKRAHAEKSEAIKQGIYDPKPNKNRSNSESGFNYNSGFSDFDDIFKRARERTNRDYTNNNEFWNRTKEDFINRSTERMRQNREVEDAILGAAILGGGAIYGAKKLKDKTDEHNEKMEKTRKAAKIAAAAGIGGAGLGLYGLNKYKNQNKYKRSEINNTNN